MPLCALNISMNFGALIALQNITLTADVGKILGLIGPNGAGKTTLVNIISGFQKPSSGIVENDGHELTNLTPQSISYQGIVRTFQGARIFPSMSVLENAQIGALGQGTSTAVSIERSHEALERMGLIDFKDHPASRLTYGQERALDLARALTAQPKFLLLDEPAAGMNEDETNALKEAVKGIVSDLDMGIILIEHDMSLVMAVCDEIHVLVKGETLIVGDPQTVRNDPEVLSSYLGEAAGAEQ